MSVENPDMSAEPREIKPENNAPTAVKRENEDEPPAARKLPRADDPSSEHAVVVPKRAPQLKSYGLKTGIAYDVRMRYHSRAIADPASYVDPHPEDPRRTFRIYRAIAEAGLIEDETLQGSSNLGELMKKIESRKATEEELYLKHTAKMVDFLKSSVNFDLQTLKYWTEVSDSIYINNDSYEAARLSAGGVIEACKAVVEGSVKNAIAVVRPPGHHAGPDAPAGFCLFANVAIASEIMFRNHGDRVKKILVFDWDVHHGNGTQKAFLEDDRVLYISIHRYDNATFYPGTTFAGANVVGDGKGKGYTVNIPWSCAGMGDGDYITAFHKIVMPIASEFDPDLVIVSAGFDAAQGDPIGGCHVSPHGYQHMLAQLMSLAEGKVVVTLEGGYNLDSISKSALAITKVLLGDAPGRLSSSLPSDAALRVFSEVQEIQSAYWKSMGPPTIKFEPEIEAYHEHQLERVEEAEKVRSAGDEKLKVEEKNMDPEASDGDNEKVSDTDLSSNSDAKADSKESMAEGEAETEAENTNTNTNTNATTDQPSTTDQASAVGQSRPPLITEVSPSAPFALPTQASQASLLNQIAEAQAQPSDPNSRQDSGDERASTEPASEANELEKPGDATSGAASDAEEDILSESKLEFRSEKPKVLNSLLDVVNDYEKYKMSRSLGFSNLPLIHGPIGDTKFQATPNIYDQDAVVLFFRPTSLIWAHKDPITGRILPEESVVASPTIDYINWAVGKGYGVIDIFFSPFETVTPAKFASHVSDNIIRFLNARKLFILGAGQGYAYAVQFMAQRDVRQRLGGIFCFVGPEDPLRQFPINSDESSAKKLHNASLMFTSCDNSTWKQKYARKKCGRLIKSDGKNLHAVMRLGFEEVTEFIEAEAEEDEEEELSS